MATMPPQSPHFANPAARTPWRANWLVVLFALPFVGIGLHLIGSGVLGLFGEDPGIDEVMQIAGGFVFTAMGSMGVFLAFQDGRTNGELAERQMRHPGEPWLWRADWASGRIPCAGRATALAFLTFAVIWNVFCIPMLWAVPSSDAPFIWIFLIVGMGLATLAGVATWRWLRFGRSVLELATLPGRPGGRFRGTILLRGSLRPAKGFRATLSCVGFTSGRNAEERILWQEEGIVPPASTTLGPTGTSVPVDFPIPTDASPSCPPVATSGIRWRVELTADLPGVDFASTFEVPIFQIGDAQPLARDDASGATPDFEPVLQPEAPMALDRERYTPESPNRLLLLGADGAEVRLPAARNKGQAAFWTAVAFLWSFFAALAWFAAPLLFGVLFAAAWVLLIFVSITAWLRSWRIAADLSGVAVTVRFLGIGWTRRVPANAIEKIVPKIMGEWGKRPCYDLRIHRTGGRPIRAGDGVRSKREAEWLCAALWRAVRGSSGDVPLATSSQGR